ncbi:vomeronasal 1 receptor ornAnaV1R3064 [Ornithorhynchus anatinus]|uniref:Vomeronasal type-1 receptor n=1 Tax=Ornithorhynchus anatinus TaxID=9258 RepID=A0A6I8MZS5_ORNAN|nr:vomeronasal 1 receptor ornAnaV1R3064 [Ornithorhynchus anatinus]
MNATEISLGILYLLKFTTGVSMNVFLLLFYCRVISTSPKINSSDLILAHLTLANTIVLLILGIPETLSAWGLRNFLGDTGCKIIMYLFRVARGLAICTTCLLSVFQAVTISPGTSQWAGVKAKLPRCIIPSCVLSWILNLLVEFDTLLNMTGPQSSNSVQIMLDLKYCSKVSDSSKIHVLIAVVRSLRDMFFVGLMIVTSGYMVFVLHRHHRQVRHLQGPSHPARAMPEVRAAKRVIVFVTLYVILYGRQSIMLSVLLTLKGYSPLLVKSHMVLSFTFSTISPFLIIHGDRRIRMFRKRESLVSDMEPS